MSTLVKTKTEDQSGKKFRLVVRSAEEAVRVIRDKLGDKAKVLSVRQVGGEGLKRFISSPKLEVIAQVVEEDDVVEEAIKPEVIKVESGQKSPLTMEDQVPPDPKPKLVEPVVPSDSTDPKSSSNFDLLAKFGFDQGLLSDIRSWSNWERLEKSSIADVLKEITIGLSDRFRGLEVTPTTEKIALLGGPGVGKTTTLCKFLAHEVFMNKTTPSVLKIENGVPNPDDALRIFCEVVGVTLFRESESLPNIDQNNPLFLDFPGLGISEIDEWRNTNNVLDNLGVETRILVINGAYDKEIIYKSIRSARYANASHIAITHFDEMSNSTKLWPIVFHSNLTPICVCNGQNVTGDFSTSVLNQFIAKTFPEELYSKGFSTYQRI
jgi:flagellar biosynthesis protein FlhF